MIIALIIVVATFLGGFLLFALPANRRLSDFGMLVMLIAFVAVLILESIALIGANK